MDVGVTFMSDERTWSATHRRGGKHVSKIVHVLAKVCRVALSRGDVDIAVVR